MTLRPKTIAWWDLETTGNVPVGKPNVQPTEILEVGIVMTDIRLNILGTKQILHGGPTLSLRLIDVDPTVLKMHSVNGLWEELRDVDVKSVATADDEIRTWMWGLNRGQEHIAFAGSGVGHFDRQYIKRDYPKTDKIMTYWPLDIGVTRRMLDLAEINASGPDDLLQFVEQKPHRALDDALLALQEARAWVNRQRELRNYEPWTFSDHP